LRLFTAETGKKPAAAHLRSAVTGRQLAHHPICSDPQATSGWRCDDPVGTTFEGISRLPHLGLDLTTTSTTSALKPNRVAMVGLGDNLNPTLTNRPSDQLPLGSWLFIPKRPVLLRRCS